MTAADLLSAITRCPVVDRCREGERLACSTIVASQAHHVAAFQVPEPWSGHLKAAPLLFVSSNPSIDHAEVYPTASWTNAARVDFFYGRFDPRPEGAWIDDRMRARHVDPAGQPSRGTTFWLATRARARELLDPPVVPGVDYALTEVVHCKSQEQLGVAEAAAVCVSRWLRPVMRLAAARVVVLMGRQAQQAFLNTYPGLAATTWSGPHDLEGRLRMILRLPHPNARVRRANCAPLTLDELEAARAYLRGA
jgi:hypothetical protein